MKSFDDLLKNIIPQKTESYPLLCDVSEKEGIAPVESQAICTCENRQAESPDMQNTIPEAAAPVKSEKRTWCIGYLQGNCEFAIRKTLVMQCGHGGNIRKVIDMPDCPVGFWTKDSK